MKKILLVLSVLLVAFSACGTSYNKVVKESESFLKDFTEDEEGYKLFNIEDGSKDSIKGQNRVFELKDIDFEIKKSQDIVMGSEDASHILNVVQFKGNVDEYFEYLGYSSSYCTVGDVLVIDYSSSTDLKKLCETLDGEYEE